MYTARAQAREPAVRERPLVLLPGMLCSARLWEPVVTRLPFPARTVQTGLHGDSVDRMVDHVLDTGPARFDLAGLSLGGIVAMALARRAPHRIGRLALLSTNARPPRPDQYEAWRALEAAVRSGAFPAAGITSLLAGCWGTDDLRAGDPLYCAASAMAAEIGPGRFVEQLRAQATRVDLRPALPEVAGEVLVVAGAGDRLCPPAVHEEIAALLPRASLHVVPDCGHLSPLERPDEIAALLARFIGGQTAHQEGTLP